MGAKEAIRSMIGLGLLGVMVSGTAMPASATSGADEAVSSIEAASASIEGISGVAPLVGAVGGIDGGGEVAVPVSNGEVVIDTSDGVVTLDQADAEVTVGIADSTSEPSSSSDGYAVFATGDDASTVVLPQRDGGAQLIDVIDGATAPTSFEYQLTVPEGASVEIEPVAGGVIVSDAAGAFVAGVAPPWAVDAVGSELATHFELAGSTLTQVVAHVGPETVYPVAADPSLGTSLFSSVRTNFPQDTVVSLRLSSWGVAVWARGGRTTPPVPLAVPQGILRGQVIINQYGWPEMLSRIFWRIRPVFDTTSVRQQFECHALGWIADYRGWEWNLERTRVAMNRHWANNVVDHRCDWNRADGGLR
ncbi:MULTISPECIES: hypothetical protein [unclassified Agrococcus]|uniref:hypothetical protein n=1 Tax=unclassified Agrococcus TaxID=2615065 RepID=UPI00360D5BEE